MMVMKNTQECKDQEVHKLLLNIRSGNAEVVDVRATGSLDFNHTHTDQVYSIPIDTVIKRSEKVYALVDEARQSAGRLLQHNKFTLILLKQSKETQQKD